jgi:hypothetical protein
MTQVKKVFTYRDKHGNKTRNSNFYELLNSTATKDYLSDEMLADIKNNGFYHSNKSNENYHFIIYCEYFIF